MSRVDRAASGVLTRESSGTELTPKTSSRQRLRLASIKSQQTILSFVEALGTSRTSCLIELGPWWFSLVWFALLATHTLLALYFFFVAYMHWYLIWIHSDTMVIGLGEHVRGFFPLVIAANGALATANAICVLASLIGSLWERRLSLGDPQRLTSSFSLRSSKRAIPGRRLVARGAMCTRKVFGSAGLFGIEGEHFEVVFRLMEVVETGAQTYQAWKLSKLVLSVWINRMYAIVIALSCWTTPIAHVVFRHRTALRRVMSISLNGACNFVALTVFPLAIFLPYAKAFDPSVGDFPLNFYYEDSWFIKAVAENRQLFVSDTVDFLTKISPAASLLLNLIALRGCFVLSSPSRVHVSVPVTSGPSENSIADGTHSRSQMSGIVEVFFVVWGVIVASLHIRTTNLATSTDLRGCYLNLRPWFATKYSCAVLEVNCEVQGHFGSVTDMDNALSGFDSSTLRGLVIADCPELQMPNRFQLFSQLYLLKIYNSAIQSWPADAAISSKTHPQLTQIYIARTNTSMGEVPIGMISEELPSSLIDIEFSVSNIRTLPESVGEKWQSVAVLVVEASCLEDFPVVVAQLPLIHISLARNQITSIPNDLLAKLELWTLWLGQNPIVTLPDTIGMMNLLVHMNLGDTSIVTLPDWMTDQASRASEDTFGKTVFVELGGSPVCSEGDRSTPLETNKFFSVECEEPLDTNWVLFYPLTYEDELRASRKVSLLHTPRT